MCLRRQGRPAAAAETLAARICHPPPRRGLRGGGTGMCCWVHCLKKTGRMRVATSSIAWRPAHIHTLLRVLVAREEQASKRRRRVRVCVCPKSEDTRSSLAVPDLAVVWLGRRHQRLRPWHVSRSSIDRGQDRSIDWGMATKTPLGGLDGVGINRIRKASVLRRAKCRTRRPMLLAYAG